VLDSSVIAPRTVARGRKLLQNVDTILRYCYDGCISAW